MDYIYLASDGVLKPAPAPVPALPCEECQLKHATLRCNQCAANYCSPCDQIVHASSRSLRAHKKIPVTQAVSVPNQCLDHPNQTKRYFCSQDNALLCSECALSHKEHTIMSITEAVSHC